jgi:putative flippase GtrA
MPILALPNIVNNKFLKRFIGFSFVGVCATIFNMTLTFVLLKIVGLSAYITFVLSYGISIFLSYYLNSRLVFKSGKSMKNLVLYYLTYLVSMLIGLGTLYIYKKLLTFDDLILNYMVIPVTMIWDFLVSSKVLKPQTAK